MELQTNCLLYGTPSWQRSVQWQHDTPPLSPTKHHYGGDKSSLERWTEHVHVRYEKAHCLADLQGKPGDTFIPIEKQHMLYYNWTFKNYTAWHGGVLNSRVDSKLFPKPIGVLPTSSTPSHSSRPVPLEALEAFCGVFVEWLIATGRARVFGLTTVKAGARSMMAKFFDERCGKKRLWGNPAEKLDTRLAGCGAALNRFMVGKVLLFHRQKLVDGCFSSSNTRCYDSVFHGSLGVPCIAVYPPLFIEVEQDVWWMQSRMHSSH